MLRDPVERAFSAYKHELARGFETEPFERALELEDERLEGQAERMLADPDYQSFSHRHHAYLRRGQYAEQLQPAAQLLPRRPDPRDRERAVLRAARGRPTAGCSTSWGCRAVMPDQLRPLERPPELARCRSRRGPGCASTSAATTSRWPTLLGRDPAWLS